MKGKKYHVKLTEAEKKRLLEITKKGKHPVRQIIRANILLHLDEGDPARSIAEQEGIERVLNRNHKTAKWQFTTENARIKLHSLYPVI
jgi:hypothetical protein